MTKILDPKKPVQSRGGNKAYILKTDMNLPDGHTILYVVIDESGTEYVHACYDNGRVSYQYESELDLVNVPEKPKERVVWLNVYDFDFLRFYDYPSKEEADHHAGEKRVACIKVTWRKGDGLDENQ